MAVSGEQLSELMSAYLDGEVTDREKAVVEEALRTDPGARKLLDELRRTVAVVGSLPRHGAPQDLALELDARLERTQLLAGFREEPQAAPARSSSVHYFRAAAMLGFVVVAGWWFLARQQQPLSHVVNGPTPAGAELRDVSKSVPAEATVTKPEKVEAETLLASGADPVTLVKHSFEVEPVRIRVTARNAAERDLLTRKFVEQLAQAHTENLARRSGEAKDGGAVGSFYLEGKPGLNFQNSQEKQILVRLPHVQAEQLVDKVVSGAQVPSDQFAIQVGAATVRGQENARLMLQGMAGNAPVASSERAKSGTAASGEGAMSSGLLQTLEKIVGIPPGPPGSRAAHGERVADASVGTFRESDELKKETGASLGRTSAADSADVRNHAVVAASEAKDSKKPASDSLVARRYDAATSRSAERDRTVTETGAATSMTPSPQGNFITIVVEFAVPESSRRDTGRMRS